MKIFSKAQIKGSTNLLDYANSEQHKAAMAHALIEYQTANTGNVNMSGQLSGRFVRHTIMIVLECLHNIIIP